MNKKKIVFTGIILILVMMFAVTCDTPAAEEVEYTDVVYSPNGSEITLYLDGVGVPVTPAQRAINRELATMAYDYFEVIFVGSTGGEGDTARTSWELGQPAGIANVPRGATGVGINYAFTTAKATTSPFLGLACMFVGKKSDKTLLGIGTLTSATHKGTAPSSNATTGVASNTTSVKFSVAAIQTGLLAWDMTKGTVGTGIREGLDGSGSAAEIKGVMFNSFNYENVASDSGTSRPGSAPGYAAISGSNAVRSDINGSPLKYPRYSLPQDNGAAVYATYQFSHVDTGTATTGTYELFDIAKVINNSTSAAPNFLTGAPLVQKRVPRFMNGGRYMEPKEAWTTTTKVNFWAAGITGTTPAVGDYRSTNTTLNTSPFSRRVGLQFLVQGSGIFSFYLEIPVYMLTQVSSTFNGGGNDAVAAQKWFIRTGVGSELYSLDDGIANGGCVFMSVGASAANWLDIEWEWIN